MISLNSVPPFDPIYKSLYEIYHFSDSDLFQFECFNFTIKGDKCVNNIQDSRDIKLESFMKINTLLVIIHNKIGFIEKWMIIDVDYIKVNYQLSYNATTLSEIEVCYKINKIDTNTPDNYQMTPYDILNQFKRDININKILN